VETAKMKIFYQESSTMRLARQKSGREKFTILEGIKKYPSQ